MKNDIKMRCFVPSQNNPSKVSAITNISLYGIVGVFVFLFVIIVFEFLFVHGERKDSSIVSSILFLLWELVLIFGHRFNRYLKKADGVVWGTIWKLIFNKNLLSKSINCSFLKWGKFDYKKKSERRRIYFRVIECCIFSLGFGINWESSS